MDQGEGSLQGKGSTTDLQGEVGIVAHQEETQGELWMMYLREASHRGGDLTRGPQGEALMRDPQGEALTRGPQGEVLMRDPQGEALMRDPQGEALMTGPQGEALAVGHREETRGEMTAQEEGNLFIEVMSLLEGMVINGHEAVHKMFLDQRRTEGHLATDQKGETAKRTESGNESSDLLAALHREGIQRVAGVKLSIRVRVIAFISSKSVERYGFHMAECISLSSSRMASKYTYCTPRSA
jgi:hypothetical protein